MARTRIRKRTTAGKHKIVKIFKRRRLKKQLKSVEREYSQKARALSGLETDARKVRRMPNEKLQKIAEMYGTDVTSFKKELNRRLARAGDAEHEAFIKRRRITRKIEGTEK